MSGCESVNMQDIIEFMENYEITGKDIVSIVLNEGPVNEECSEDTSHLISHAQGLQYVGQQEEARQC